MTGDTAHGFPLARPAIAGLVGGTLLALAAWQPAARLGRGAHPPVPTVRAALEPAHVSVWLAGGR